VEAVTDAREQIRDRVVDIHVFLFISPAVSAFADATGTVANHECKMLNAEFPKFIIHHSAIIIGPLPAALGDSGKLGGGGQLAETDAADAEFLEDAARAATATAAGVAADLEFGGPLLLLDE
jgi:hypothetical protein